MPATWDLPSVGPQVKAEEGAREQLFASLVAQAYERGKATEAAAFLEIDAVIDPADTRAMVLRALG